MEVLAWLLIMALAGWRVAVSIVFEEGPFNLTLRFRRRIGIEHDADDNPVGYPDNVFGKLFGCVFCLSFWTTGIMYGIVMLSPIPVMILATWGLACWIHNLAWKSDKLPW